MNRYFYNIRKLFVTDVQKAYTEGVYSDTPANRKLGRVGMRYTTDSSKQNGEKKEKVIEREVKPKIEDFEENIINDDNQIKISYSDKEGNQVGDMVIFKDSEEKTLYLEHIKISKDYRQKGLGRQIFKKGIQLSNKESNNFDTIELSVDNAENSAIQDKEEQKKNNQYLTDFYKSEGFEFKSEEEKDELNPIMIKKLKKAFAIEEIKQKFDSELNKLKMKNDYVSLSADNGYTFRFSRNASEGKGFNECLVKSEEGKVLKTFKNAHEEDLMHSVYKYFQKLGANIVPIEDKGGKEEVSVEHNTSTIKKKMQEAKDNQTGTILVKGSGGNLIYLNRNRQGRWLKDFDAYTIRDSKKNVLNQGKANSEEALINKLNEFLSKNKIKLDNEQNDIEINIPNKVYHKAPPSIRKDILKEGLKPKIGDSYKLHWDWDSEKKLEPAIFAYDKDKEEYDTTYDDDIYEIDTTKLKKENWKSDPDKFMYNAFGSIIYNKEIPKEAIKLIYRGTGESF